MVLSRFRSLLLASAALAIAAAPAGAKTLVYCSEGSPENFSPMINTTGTTFAANRSRWTAWSASVQKSIRLFASALPSPGYMDGASAPRQAGGRQRSPAARRARSTRGQNGLFWRP